jgi:hypothetical protein
MSDLDPAIAKLLEAFHDIAQRNAFEVFHGRLRIAESAAADAEAKAAAADRRLSEAIGVNGDNGKLGRTVDRVKSLEGSRTWLWGTASALAVAAVSAIVIGLSAARDVGNREGRTDTRIEQLEHDVERLTDLFWAPRARSNGVQP